MPTWLANLPVILSLIQELIKLIQNEKAQTLVSNLKNAKTSMDKQAALNAIGAELYK